MVVTDKVLVNRACARIGAKPLQTMTETTSGGEAAQLTYDSMVEFLFGLYPFSFSKVTAQLTQLTDAPEYSGYAYKFVLPADRLGPPLKIRTNIDNPDNNLTAYILSENTVHADTTPLFAEYQKITLPHTWTGTFREAFVLALASELAMVLRHDASLRDQLKKEAFGRGDELYRGGAFGAAVRQDGFSTPAKKLRHDANPMTAAWSG